MYHIRIIAAAMVLWGLANSHTDAAADTPAGQAQMNFHVATDGHDEWTGRLSAANADRSDGPFATIARARAAVRKARAAGSDASTVFIRGGTYRLDQPLVFKPEDSGTVAKPIRYVAWPGEQPIISGGRRIEGWTQAQGDVWFADVPGVQAGRWSFQQLFVNGQRRTRARTPNEGYLRVDGFLPGITDPQKKRDDAKSKLGFRFASGDLKQWNNLDDVVIVLFHSWTASLSWIAELNEEARTVTFTAPTGWPIGYWEKHPRYYVENLHEALDAPGEWYLDRKAGRVYYRPMPGEDMAKAVVEAPAMRKLVIFEGDWKKGSFVQGIRLEGLSFQHADWFVADRGPADGQAAAWLEAAVFAQGTRHCALVDCEIAHVGEYALYFERGCRFNRAVQCHIHDLGAGGVRVGYMDDPPNDHAVTSHNAVDNCFIHDGGHVFHAGVGAWIGRSSFNTLHRNVIRDFDYTGISVGWSWGYAPSSAHHNMIQGNQVSNIGRGVLSDMGGIYTLGISPSTVIRNNLFHDIQSYNYGGWGLYTDEGSSDILLENNIVYNTKTGGFHQHYGKNNIVRNNILAFSQQGQLQRSREETHTSFIFERNIVLFDRGTLLNGKWDDGHFSMDYNLYWNIAAREFDFAGMSFDQWQGRGFDQHSRIADPKFVDSAAHDFQLRPDSPALEMGFKPIDTSQIGLYGDPEWVALPERAAR